MIKNEPINDKQKNNRSKKDFLDWVKKKKKMNVSSDSWRKKWYSLLKISEKEIILKERYFKSNKEKPWWTSQKCKPKEERVEEMRISLSDRSLTFPLDVHTQLLLLWPNRYFFYIFSSGETWLNHKQVQKWNHKIKFQFIIADITSEGYEHKHPCYVILEWVIHFFLLL